VSVQRPVTPRTRTERWLYAYKPASWPKTLVPFALGQTAGAAIAGRIAWAPLALGLAFTAADTVYIVLLNDWGDRRVDALKRRLFPEGCSPKTIPDGILPASAVRRAGLAAAVAALAIAVAGEVILGRPGLVLGATAALGIFAAYTFPPFQLNYRGGGELLEAAGIGLALPTINGYLQAGTDPAGGLPVGPVALAVLAGYLPFSLASAVASGLSDEVSDRRGGKRTVVTSWGNGVARGLCGALAVAGVGGWVGVGVGLPGMVGLPDRLALGCLAAGATAALELPAMFRMSPLAVTNAFGPQGRYKMALHRAAWRGGLVLAMFLGWIALDPR